MRFQSIHVLAALFSTVSLLLAQQQSPREKARIIDKQLIQLNDLSDSARKQAIESLAAQIRAQPPKYAEALAFNLVVDGTQGSDGPTLQLITDLFAETLSKLPADDTVHANSFDQLAELVRYGHVHTSLPDPRLKAAMDRLEEADRKRGEAGFDLTDMR